MRSLAALVLVLVAAGAAAAQLPVTACEPPALSFTPAAARLVPGAEATFTLTVSNPNRVPASATVSIGGPPGFAVDPPSATLASIPGGGEATVRVRVSALETAVVDSTGQLLATGMFRCGQDPVVLESQSSEAFADLTVVAPPATPIDGLLGYLQDPAVLAAGGLALVILVGALALRRSREGFVLTCPEPAKTLRAGRGTSFPLEIENRAAATDTAILGLGDVPNGWTAFTALPEVQLGSKEARTLWLMVRAPPSARPGDSAEVEVKVQSRGHPDRASSLRVRATVAEDAPESEAPPSS